MTGEEDSEVLSRNLSSTTNSNISFNNQNPTASSTSSVLGIVSNLSKRDDKVDGQGLSEDRHNNDGIIIKTSAESVKHSNHVDSEARVKKEDDNEGFGSVDDFEEDDDEDAMQIDLSRTADSPEDLHVQHDGKDSLIFSGCEQDASAICSSTSGSGNANLLVEPVNSTTNIGSSLRSPLLPLPSHSSLLGACSSAIVGGRTPGQISRSDSQSQDLNDDPDILILTTDEFVTLPPERVSHVYGQLGESYRSLHCRLQDSLDEIAQLKESLQRSQLQVSESSRRENLLVMRLTTKEQEMQEYVVQVNELKSAVVPTSSSLRSALMDPAVNLIILKMKKELEETKKKLEDTQNDLNAWKFTPDSNTGKRLMAKCRMLYQENEELGKMISSGRLAKLESDLALQKSLTEEMKKSQSELDELVQELDEDVEGMQSTVCFLQQQLRDMKQSANPSSNPNHSVSEAELVSVNVTELCAQCRAIQEKKKQQEEQSQKLELPHSQIKLDHTSPDSSPSSSCEPPVTQTRTWVNGEVDGLMMENERKPLSINSKLNHLMSKLESSKSNFNHGLGHHGLGHGHDDALTNDVNVNVNVHVGSGSDNNAVSTGGSSVANNFVQIHQSVTVKKEKEEEGAELCSLRQKRKLPSRGAGAVGGDLPTYESETISPMTKRTKRTYPTSSQCLHNSSPITGSSINSNVVVNSSSVSVRNSNSAGESVPFPSSSSSFINSPTTANGNGSLEH